MPIGSVLDEIQIFSNIKAHLFEKSSGMQSIYKILSVVKEQLINININKGYVLSIDIFDDKHYPLVASLIKQLILKKDYEKLTNHEKVSCYV